jgi:adenylate cyclase class 2
MKPHKTPTRRPPAAAGEEIEVKLPVADRAALRRRLRRLRAKPQGVRVHEMNTLYDTPESGLRGSGRMLRIRVEQPASEHGQATKTAKAAPLTALLTFKGPALPEVSAGPAYKVRDERESRVLDGKAVAGILEGIGLRPSFRYEKYRSTFRLPGLPGLKVELDETPIGDFLELEGGIEAIDRAAKILGFGPTDYITRSYPALYAEHASNRPVAGQQGGPLPASDMLFATARMRAKTKPKMNQR